ncbi:hypothetical protein [Mycobacterium mantenii]|uniref:Uncharacterized protein n=1 Tax=Mycobacterium mantenii TaxID=560555 RepID=A0A1A2T203_MYCNT|nr:hypothetical protein [Mycobacterium mantenii]OBH43429.1 hypothetical protein A5688_12990 [Mycobacterium mantenii]OBH70454.1 hypothetical protein A5683_00635 [Mycobacterium mantenii]
MSLKPGMRLSTPASACEVLVVRPPGNADEGVLTCAGAEMAAKGAKGLDGASVDIQLGKRYLDESSGLEVLCVKAGSGPLQFAGRELVVRWAKPLPASD